jgi:hypothetical protein
MINSGYSIDLTKIFAIPAGILPNLVYQPVSKKLANILSSVFSQIADIQQLLKQSPFGWEPRRLTGHDTRQLLNDIMNLAETNHKPMGPEVSKKLVNFTLKIEPTHWNYSEKKNSCPALSRPPKWVEGRCRTIGPAEFFKILGDVCILIQLNNQYCAMFFSYLSASNSQNMLFCLLKTGYLVAFLTGKNGFGGKIIQSNRRSLVLTHPGNLQRHKCGIQNRG